MRAPLYLAMSDAHFWGAFLVIGLTAAFVLYAFAAGLARPEHGCTCRSGHACFRALGHPGKCWDAGGPLEPVAYRRKCDAVQRPKDWDSRGRAEANR